MLRRSFVLVAVLLGCLTNVALANGSTKEAAVALVEKAAKYLKANGKAKLLEELNVKDGQFQHGELYVFAYDLQATILAHPVNPKLVGRNWYEVADPDGKYFRKDIVELAKSKGTGWVDYKYKNPVTNKVEAKTSYIMLADDLILVAGVYKD